MEKRKVVVFSRPRDYWYESLQKYYRASIERYIKSIDSAIKVVPVGKRANIIGICSSYHYHQILSILKHKAPMLAKWLEILTNKLEGDVLPPSGLFDSGIGQYLIGRGNKKEFKVCIDTMDSGNYIHDGLMGWCDFYFKTNFFRQGQYPHGVIPLFNCNPLILNSLDRLKELRITEKQYDICFIVRLWGGTDELGGIEHNLRLLEEVSKIDCKKFLLAVLVSGEKKNYEKRLKESGVMCTTKLMDISRLWKISALSKLNIIRLGMHYCIPWRMSDMLAMGATVVLDRSPLTAWPSPLVKNRDFLDLECDVSIGRSLASETCYKNIGQKIEMWRQDSDLIETISKNSAEYFDRWLEPLAVGRYIVETVLAGQ